MNATVSLPAALPSTARQVVRLAGPVLVEQSLLYLVGLSDTVLTGRYLSGDHLAAVTVATYLLWFIASVLTVVSVGSTALVSRLVGANDWGAAVRVTRQSIALALLIGLVIPLAGWPTAPSLVGLLNLRGESAAAATLFLRIVLTVTPLLACTTVGVACLRGAGDTRTGMWVMVAVNAINIALSWALMRGLGPFPPLGFPGIATGTALGEGAGGFIVLWVLTRGRSGLSVRWGDLRPRWTEVRRILRVSLPATGESLSNLFCQLWFLSLINRLGPVATAAHGVAIRCEAIAFLTVTAFSVAAGTLTGQYLGAGRPDLAARAARNSWAMGVAVLSVLGLVLYAFSAPMFSLFLGGRQPLVAREGVPVLGVVAFAMPALATISVLNGALRGAGDTRWPLAIVLFGYLVVRLPMTYWLTRPGGPEWGLYGAWVAMFVDLTVRGGLVAARFLQGGWRLAKV